jgi:hypothetical protein
VIQVIKSTIVRELGKSPFVVEGGHYYTLSNEGDMLIVDMRVANELTVNDILLKFNTEKKFREEFKELIKNLGYVLPDLANTEPSKTEDKPPLEPSKEQITYTYLMHDAASGCYKIGKSRNVEHREKTLGAQIPLVTTLCTAPVDIEGQLHAKYSNYRKRGEWFELPEQAVAEIKELFQLKAV